VRLTDPRRGDPVRSTGRALYLSQHWLDAILTDFDKRQQQNDDM
jgi:hypothetical protein